MINMALLFSAVRATANDQEVEFFVGGIPREYDDLEGWTAFDRFMGEIDKETEVAVHAESYLYGEEETYRATPEEVAYFMKRIEMLMKSTIGEAIGINGGSDEIDLLERRIDALNKRMRRYISLDFRS